MGSLRRSAPDWPTEFMRPQAATFAVNRHTLRDPVQRVFQQPPFCLLEQEQASAKRPNRAMICNCLLAARKRLLAKRLLAARSEQVRA